MNDKPEDLQTLIQDVKTIKSILNGTDAPMPRFWKVLLPAGLLMALAGIIRFAVPALSQMGFLEIALWFWTPAITVYGLVVLFFISREIRKTGKGFFYQSRVQNLLYVRFIIPPSLLVIAFVYSQTNQPYSFEGFFMILMAIWLTAIAPLLPLIFRTVPVVYLLVGLLEILFNLRGDLVVMTDTFFIAGGLLSAGGLFYQLEHQRRAKEGPGV